MLPPIEKVPECQESHPEPPEGPPCRQFKQTLFCGLIETEESKQKTLDWQNYMRGYNAGIDNKRPTNIPKPPPTTEYVGKRKYK